MKKLGDDDTHDHAHVMNERFNQSNIHAQASRPSWHLHFKYFTLLYPYLPLGTLCQHSGLYPSSRCDWKYTRI